MSRTPRCEVCQREPANSFSWFADRARWCTPQSGSWRFTGSCTSDSEQYYVLLHNHGTGFFDSDVARNDWLRHLSEKIWFDELNFFQMLERFEGAAGAVNRGRVRQQ